MSIYPVPSASFAPAPLLATAPRPGLPPKLSFDYRQLTKGEISAKDLDSVVTRW